MEIMEQLSMSGYFTSNLFHTYLSIWFVTSIFSTWVYVFSQVYICQQFSHTLCHASKVSKI